MASKEKIAELFSRAQKYEKYITIGTAVAEACSEITEKPTVATIAKAAFKTLKVVLDENRIWIENFFGDDWVRPFSPDFRQTIVTILTKKPHKIIVPHDNAQKIHLAELDGERIAWTTSIGGNGEEYVDDVYILKERAAHAKEALKKHLWQSIPYQFIVARCAKSTVRYGGSDIVFEKDDRLETGPSIRANEIAAYLRACFAENVNRSLVFYGPPGTGKTTITRRICEILQFKTLRIRVEDVGRLENSTIFEALAIFQPDAVILDDFDRAVGNQSLLELLEFLHRHVKLVMVTANDINFSDMNTKTSMADAILRPGRLDEEVLVINMEENTVKEILGPENQHHFEDIKNWPIAFIQEYLIRHRFKKGADLDASILELRRRVEKYLTVESDEDEEEVTPYDILGG